MSFVLYVNMICFIVHVDVWVELVKPLLCVREVPISNLGSDTMYPDSCSVFFLVCRQVRNNRSSWAKTAFFHIFFQFILTNHLVSRGFLL